MRSGTGDVSKESDDLRDPTTILARQERIPVWALPISFILIIGASYLFTFYDLFAMNITFTQTALSLGWVSSPSSPELATLEALPVMSYIAAYMVGALGLAPLSDRMGRRTMLMVALLIAGIGSAVNGLAPDYATFVAARTLTGLGIGADFAVSATYVSELVPALKRGRYASALYVVGAIGVVASTWISLVLVTPPAPFPYGLPFALGASGWFAANGWRLVYWIGGLLAVLGAILRFALPESTRWLIAKGRIGEADRVVSMMEARALRKVGSLPPPRQVPAPLEAPGRVPYSEILGNPSYRRRFAILLPFWMLTYITVYIGVAGLAIVLGAIGFGFPVNEMLVALGSTGDVAAMALAALIADRFDRRRLVALSAAISLAGVALLAPAVGDMALALLGSFVYFLGFNMVMPIAFTVTAELFPTRARASGFALSEGLGHIGGAISMFAASAILYITSDSLLALLAVTSFQVAAAVLIQLAPRTTARILEEVSP